MSVRFLSSSNCVYSLFHCDALGAGATWAPVPDHTDIPGNGGPLILTDPATVSGRFYRVSVRVP